MPARWVDPADGRDRHDRRVKRNAARLLHWSERDDASFPAYAREIVMAHPGERPDPIDTPLTINQPVNTTNILGQEGVGEDIDAVADEDDELDDDELDDELDDAKAGSSDE